MQRIILHIDLDYFYAQVEEKRNPSIKNRPVVVCQYSGRTAESGAVTTTNYVARGFGVRSGMSISRAKKLLDGKDALFLQADHNLYDEASDRIMDILRKYADVLEVVGVDEAYLDVSKRTSGRYEEAEKIARKIKDEVMNTESLTCSIGLSPNKLISKIASEFKKPDGLTAIRPHQVEKFLLLLPVGRLYGVGVKTEKKLKEMKIETIGQLALYDASILMEKFGRSLGNYLHLAALGEDNEPVEERGMRAQISRIATLKENTREMDTIGRVLDELAEDVHRMVTEGRLNFKSVSVMAIMEDLSTYSKTRTLETNTDSLDSIKRNARQLFKALLDGQKEKSVRRVGVRVSNLKEKSGQVSLTEFA